MQNVEVLPELDEPIATAELELKSLRKVLARALQRADRYAVERQTVVVEACEITDR